MKQAITKAVARMECLRFFPAGAAAQQEIMRLLERIVATPGQLDWLVRTMVDQVGEWHGPAELRGVFCTRFRPRDGIEANCISTPGFTAADLEQRQILQQEALPQLLGTDSFTEELVSALAAKKLITSGKRK